MFFAGVDVGSRTTKAVLLDAQSRVAAQAVSDTGVRGAQAAEKVLGTCLSRAQISRQDLTRVVATGYGRKNVPAASTRLTEISCHARGAHKVLPGVRTVVDIGGQDSKVIVLDGSGRMVDFAMNDRCAAGTGRFLEVMAKVLEIGLGAMGGVREAAPSRRAPINNLCTVFAESEVISLLAEGRAVEDIVRGVHASIAERTAALLGRVAFEPPIVMSGGVALNRGVVAALQQRLQRPVQVPPDPQLIGALGAACLARDEEAASRS